MVGTSPVVRQASYVVQYMCKASHLTITLAKTASAATLGGGSTSRARSSPLMVGGTGLEPVTSGM